MTNHNNWVKYLETEIKCAWNNMRAALKEKNYQDADKYHDEHTKLNNELREYLVKKGLDDIDKQFRRAK